MPTACLSSPARDWTHTAAANWATAVKTWVLNPLSHQGTPFAIYFSRSHVYAARSLTYTWDKEKEKKKFKPEVIPISFLVHQYFPENHLPSQMGSQKALEPVSPFSPQTRGCCSSFHRAGVMWLTCGPRSGLCSSGGKYQRRKLFKHRRTSKLLALAAKRTVGMDSRLRERLPVGELCPRVWKGSPALAPCALVMLCPSRCWARDTPKPSYSPQAYQLVFLGPQDHGIT